MSNKYIMRISRMTVDKLGVRLYDKVSAVIAELIANSYDADATKVVVEAPMGKFLARKREDGTLEDINFEIIVKDNGIGMTPDEMNNFYLLVGGERRNDLARGSKSRVLKREVMGRKGVGKLAPFGICKQIEVISSGGTKKTDSEGHSGYLTSHIILDYDKIVKDTEFEYHPTVGEFDETLSENSGTKIILRDFFYRKVPDINDFSRQLAQRFGIESSNWEIKLVNNNSDESQLDMFKDDPDIPDNYETIVGSFQVDTMPETKIEFRTGMLNGKPIHAAFNSDNAILNDLPASIVVADKELIISGWVGYAKQNYKDDLMAGIRIYCRGKIAAQTSLFNLKSGFTGEYDVRSYIVGQINADWLDDSEDLIQTDRRDILWSSEIGGALEKWGQQVVKKVGTISRKPMAEKTWSKFQEKSDIENKINARFPGDQYIPIRTNALSLAKSIGRTMREGEVDDQEQVDFVIDLSMDLAPHITLNNELQKAADEAKTPIGAIFSILRTAQIAELSSYGLIAQNRVKVIERLNGLKNTVGIKEDELQKEIASAPWLINPQWSPMTANQTFSTLKKEFERFYERKTGTAIHLDDLENPTKRCDFVLHSHEGCIHIIEIKKPNWSFTNDEMDRLQKYVETMQLFLTDDGHKKISEIYRDFHIDLVCDGMNLSGIYKLAFEGLESNGKITRYNWSDFLMRTKLMHEDFLKVATRQRMIASLIKTN